MTVQVEVLYTRTIKTEPDCEGFLADTDVIVSLIANLAY